jgi:hypothetical protein
MIDVSVLVDKLNSFETTKDVADFLNDQNVQGTPGSAETCVISQWISRESGKNITTSDQIKVWKDAEDISFFQEGAGKIGHLIERYERSEIVRSFVYAFDMGAFPELIGTLTNLAVY